VPGAPGRARLAALSFTEFATPAVVKRALDARVRAAIGQQRTTDSAVVYTKALGILALTVGGYWYLVFEARSAAQAMAAGLVLALGLVGIGFNVQHDGNHGGLSRAHWLNRVAGFTLDLIGASSYFWRQRHNHNHHTYTNIPDQDADIAVGWFARMAADQPWRWFHRYQQFYLWFLYAFVHVRYLWSDWQALATGRIDCAPVRRPHGWDLVAFLGGKAIYFGWALALPMTRHSPLTVVGGFLAVSMVMGVIFSVVFQLAHTVDTVEHPTVASSAHCDEWVVHQIRTTANFATGNRWITAALGGLNFQREHHLFPKVSHVHYPALAKIVKDVCREHNVPVAESPTLWLALRSHYRFLKAMGVRPIAA
jgi:linoleoyl-CoA desaturase